MLGYGACDTLQLHSQGKIPRQKTIQASHGVLLTKIFFMHLHYLTFVKKKIIFFFKKKQKQKHRSLLPETKSL